MTQSEFLEALKDPRKRQAVINLLICAGLLPESPAKHDCTHPVSLDSPGRFLLSFCPHPPSP